RLHENAPVDSGGGIFLAWSAGIIFVDMVFSRSFLAAAAGLLLLSRVPLDARSAAPTGLFVGTLLNAHPLPRIERVPSQDGWEHWFKLERALVTLRPDGRFIASFKYYRQHVKPRAAVNPGPLLNETYKGKFIVKGTSITFNPEPTKQRRKPPPIVGTIVGDRMNIPYIVAEGQSRHPLRLDMKRQSSW
ncbi:MAG TPA: hypothetical protein VHM24_10085, partial [Gemmatimonadaceae bacterium]|nr:hypothetical protein [Gemmatimonadaceae bacterium]